MNQNDPSAWMREIKMSPDACILNYGTLGEAERTTPLGEPFDFAAQQQRARLSVSLHLHEGCPPFFIWQTNADDPRLGCDFVKALTDRAVPCEFHIFAEGAHGGGLYNGEHPYAPHCRSTVRWAQMAAEFLQNLGFPTEA